MNGVLLAQNTFQLRTAVNKGMELPVPQQAVNFRNKVTYYQLLYNSDTKIIKCASVCVIRT